MLLPAERITRLHILPIKVWVLAPQLVTTDANLDYYYDFTQSIAEYTRVFTELHLEWQWQPVTTSNYPDIIDTILAEKNKGLVMPVVLNLCDGDEVNGTPGISVVQLLEKKGLVYTGSDEHFYRITTSKIPMKQAFDSAGVNTPAWEAITDPDQDLSGIFQRLGSPIILKPAVSGGSMGVGFAIPASNAKMVLEQIVRTGTVTRGWIGAGLDDLTPEMADALGLGPARGVLIMEVLSGSPADRGGIKVGDVVTAVNRLPVATPHALLNAVAALQPGSAAKLALLRQGKATEATVTVGRRPKPPQRSE